MAILWTGNQGVVMGDYEKYGLTNEMGMILRIAEALRDEFSISIDAHPGGIGSEAGVVNRDFRTVAFCILESAVPKGENLDDVLTRVLRIAALRRLGEIGVDGDRAAVLLNSEPGLGDAWLANMAMASREVVGELMGKGQADPESVNSLR